MIKFEDIFTFIHELGTEYKYTGSRNSSIEGFCALSSLKKNCITWIRDINKYSITNIDKNLNLLIITNFSKDENPIENYNIIECDNPRALFFEILNHFFVSSKETKIEPDSIIETEYVGRNVSIGHHCFIGKDVIIGNNVIIKNNVIIECPAYIGDDTIIYSGVVIGTDGFGYYQKNDGINYKIPHFGGIKIGKNVEIGANTCVDRGTLSDTIIGNNVKIDNLCQIAHNVKIEDNVILTSCVALCGSSILKENVYVAPGAIILDQVTVERDVFITVGSVVMRDVQENTVVHGNPARTLRNNNKDGSF
jgi:UDP-3-O-[3-hydroxymyristoyl] glucosamine N-acyltransferase